MKRTLPLLYTQGNPRRIRFFIGLVANSENFPNSIRSAQIRLSVDRPKPWSTVSVDHAQPRLMPFQSVD